MLRVFRSLTGRSKSNVDSDSPNNNVFGSKNKVSSSFRNHASITDSMNDMMIKHQNKMIEKPVQMIARSSSWRRKMIKKSESIQQRRQQQSGLATEEKKSLSIRKIEIDDGECDTSGWDTMKYDCIPTETELGSNLSSRLAWDDHIVEKLAQNNHSCQNCDVIESRYNDRIDSLSMKIRSRDAVITSFEQASLIQQDTANFLREELESKNDMIVHLRSELKQKEQVDLKLKIDLEIERRTSKKLQNKVESLQTRLSQSEQSHVEEKKKFEDERKKLNQLVKLLQSQIKAKDDALDEIMHSYAQRKKHISSLVQNVQNVEADLLSRVSGEYVTLKSQKRHSQRFTIPRENSSSSLSCSGKTQKRRNSFTSVKA